MAPAAQIGVFRFSDFIVDCQRLELRRHDERIELRPKSFDVLCCLLEGAERVLSKDELIEKVWPDVTVTDESVARCISDIRTALDDSGQTLIKTVARRGYRMGVPVKVEMTVTETPTPVMMAPAPGVPAVASGRLRNEGGQVLALQFGYRVWIGLAGLVAIVVLLVVWSRQPPGPALFAGRPSLVVLPFVNLSGDPSQDFFSDGLRALCTAGQCPETARQDSRNGTAERHDDRFSDLGRKVRRRAERHLRDSGSNDGKNCRCLGQPRQRGRSAAGTRQTAGDARRI